MARENIYNFAAGPSCLPTSVLKKAAEDMLDYRGTGMSVMEMSHRSKAYQEIFDDAKNTFRSLLKVPDTHEILFLQGGGSTQFSMIPMNFIGKTGKADYAVTGNFAGIAAKEARKYGEVFVSADTSDCGHTRIPAQSELKLSADASYFYYCCNNTIYGTEWHYVPDTGNVPLCCDMSSDIMTAPIDFSKYGLIFAGAQKNLGPAGVTAVIIDKSMTGTELPSTPMMLGYKLQVDKDSMYNTPPTYGIYILGLMLHWVEEMGGVEAMDALKRKKSGILYDAVDASRIFTAPVQADSRSYMNVVFRSGDDALDKKFVDASIEAGFRNVKGHRLSGGMRASCYNAMTVEGCEKLADFIAKFEKEI